jgi:putative membrane protein
MTEFLLHLLLTAVLLLVVAHFVRGVQIRGFGSAVIGAFLLGIVNALVRPVMVFLTFPITIVTFGLFLLVINALMLWLVAALVPGIRVSGFGAAFFGALLLTVLNLLIELLLPGF